MGKKYKILIIGLGILFAGAIIISAYFQLQEKRELTRVEELNTSFVTSWGTQEYNDFDSYKNKVKAYLSPELYAEYFQNIYSWELRKGKAISKQYSIETSIKKVSSKRKQGDTFTLVSVVEEKISSLEENKSEEKTITVTYRKINDQYLVTSIRYLN